MLGEKIKDARINKGLSLNDAAKAIGVSDTCLFRIEQGDTKKPKAYILKKIADFFDLNIIDLFIEYGYIDKNDIKTNEKEQHNNKNTECFDWKNNSSYEESIIKPEDSRIAKTYRLGELFCGPGGLAYAAINADIGNGDRIVHTWANDFDEDTCETYIHNICPSDPGSVYCEDVHELDYNKLSEIDALAFGFPCNDFSLVGEQLGIKGKYGPLYTYGIKALQKFKPQWFLAENVGGLKSANDGLAYEKILDDMRQAGYKIYPNLYKFEEYGVPQARHRIIIVGIREDIPFEFRIPSSVPYKDINVSCKYALENPPIADKALNNQKIRQSETVVRRLQYIKPGQNAFNADIPDELKLNVRGATLSQIYKRLDPEKPSYTVTGSGGGGTHMYHWDEPRALTNRERARLQTFPDDYYFYGNNESVRRQIGMAVPQKGAIIIFEAIMKTLAGIPYESQEENIREEIIE